MSSKLFNQLVNNEKIKVKTYSGLPALVCNPEVFTILLIKNHGRITINFYDYQMQGEYILFLCPNEVVQVSEYD